MKAAIFASGKKTVIQTVINKRGFKLIDFLVIKG
jgi:hypothetical protein